jgi:hypothetical protein
MRDQRSEISRELSGLHQSGVFCPGSEIFERLLHTPLIALVGELSVEHGCFGVGITSGLVKIVHAVHGNAAYATERE